MTQPEVLTSEPWYAKMKSAAKMVTLLLRARFIICSLVGWISPARRGMRLPVFKLEGSSSYFQKAQPVAKKQMT